MDNDIILGNKNKQILIEQFNKQKELFNQVLYQKSKDSLYIFNKYILGIEDSKAPLAQFHKDLCNFVTDNRKKKKLILIPRGHLKSTLITIGYSVQSIVNNPNIRILILNATWQMAVDFLTEIKRHLLTNEKIQEIFPEVYEAASNNEEWSQDRILISRSDRNIKGPTVWATGVDSNLVGSHPDLIIFDDVVNRDNSTTQEQIEKVILRYKDALDLLEPGGQLIVIGTRWSESDLYSWMMDKEQGVAASYDVMIKQAYDGDILTGEGFQALWPEKFSRRELAARLREKGWFEFSAQYMNNPIPDEAATFKRSDFQYYDFTDIRGKELTKVLTIDPAISQEKDADFTGMVGCGIDSFRNLFVLDIVREHLTPKQLIDKIFMLQEMWHFTHIGIETVAYQKALAYSLREEMQKRGRYLPITEFKSHEQSKDQRIKGLQPLYANHQIFHRKDLPKNVYLEAELSAFPRSRHDDVLDALSMQLTFLYPPRKKTNRYHNKYLYG